MGFVNTGLHLQEKNIISTGFEVLAVVVIKTLSSGIKRCAPCHLLLHWFIAWLT
jgi:hypothetical protein